MADHIQMKGEEERSSGFSTPVRISTTEHGRTFNGEGKYFLPNDGPEQNRLGASISKVKDNDFEETNTSRIPLDVQHKVWKLVMDGDLAWAPIRETELLNVLDIGTGTGEWAIDFAELHPDAQVFGTDISIIQPLYVPPNCQFVREDSEEEWVFTFPFDYIHLRMMGTCFMDYKSMVKRTFDHLRPGGWVEYQEFTLEVVSDDKHTQHVLRDDPASYRNFMQRTREGLLLFGRDIDVTPKVKDWLREAGFVDVVEKRLPVPVGPWSSNPKETELGRVYQSNAHDLIEALVKALYATTLSPEETRAYIEACQNNLKDPDLKVKHTWIVIYGRKPHIGETQLI